MHFKDTKLFVPEIAKALNVDVVVEGSVIRDGNSIRVHAQLIRVATDEHFWSEEYDRELPDVLALESDVAQSIADKVEVTLTGQERSRLVAARHVSPQAYDNYLKGSRLSGATVRLMWKRVLHRWRMRLNRIRHLRQPIPAWLRHTTISRRLSSGLLPRRSG
jgi:hypothetical protein